MSQARHRYMPRKGRRLPSLIAIVLAVIGALLITLAACSSKPGAPQPTPAQFGSTGDSGTASGSGAVSGSAAPSGQSGPGTTSAPTKAPSTTSAATSSARTPSAAGTSSPTGTSTKATSAKPSSSASVAPTPSSTSKIVVPTFANPAKGLILETSAPVSLSIPSLGVTSALLQLGLNPDGTVQVPDLNDPDSKAGWYKNSPTPGAIGPAIILGHIDSKKYGPGVFYKLGDLQPGQEIDVTRADGTVAVFKVDGVRSYPKDNFPTKDVYGNIDHAGLRLITCGGTFDFDKHSYENNIVAYASLVSSHTA